MLSLGVVCALGQLGRTDAIFPRDTLTHVVSALRAIGYEYAAGKKDPIKGALTHAGITLPGSLRESSVSGRIWSPGALSAIGVDLRIRTKRPVPNDREVIEDAPDGIDGRFMFVPVDGRTTLCGGWADVGSGSTYASTRRSLDWLWRNVVAHAKDNGVDLADQGTHPSHGLRSKPRSPRDPGTKNWQSRNHAATP